MKKIFAFLVLTALFTACNDAADSSTTSDSTNNTTVDTSMNPPAPGTVDTSKLAGDTSGAKRAIRK